MKADEVQVIPHGKGVDVSALVHEDLDARVRLGAQKYGEPLTTDNGRDALLDLYQELLDAAMYARQAIYERDNQ